MNKFLSATIVGGLMTGVFQAQAHGDHTQAASDFISALQIKICETEVYAHAVNEPRVHHAFEDAETRNEAEGIMMQGFAFYSQSFEERMRRALENLQDGDITHDELREAQRALSSFMATYNPHARELLEYLEIDKNVLKQECQTLEIS